ncbi:NACHT domain-containing protein [Herbaspirillum camelliae]|uniref:NACHT domain-containing protein n=1 Tax=Herbaspirillum camelliae TaxID=1892903 RepID=UPI000949DB0E|nr:NACHT domain-containing protein [Herbaspirillum camelliae]
MTIEFEKIDLTKIIPSLFEWIKNFNEWQSAYGVLVGVFLSALMLAALVFGSTKILAWIVSLTEAAQKLGFSFSLSRNKRLEIKQRQYFCRVIRADLEQISHSENWNDQWFTDLEAEVQAEGRFYQSYLHKFFRKGSSGYRKEPSLMTAITRTTERHMLLIGDPGSGKSVALRHLASQLAEIGVYAKGRNIKIPLYINLRELLIDDIKQVTADGIKNFILENFRRGDSNTSQYLKKNWDDFLQRGIWFFLFDSFDEIPAVLHAEKGSGVIQTYSEAIRQFMSGMSECQGLVASREFKGPESIPWQKLRLLALDNRRQLELIRNAELTNVQATIVRTQLGNSQAGIYKNPLFLSLLCRFVKDHEKAPEHSHALLMDHIVELADRDRDWIEKNTRLWPNDLLIGAEKIAAILAQEEEIGLAPTFNELARKLLPMGYAEEQTFNLLTALLYVKIGRNDVKEARQGDKRFAFSHRRYQESLFVRYLVGNPNIISIENLLLNPKWREYAVAMLQSQPIEVCQPLFDFATQKIDEWIEIDATPSEAIFIHEGAYFQWDLEQEVHLLNLLQEGMVLRSQDVPPQLSKSIESLVEKRWENGDAYDRLMSITLGGLVPSAALEARVVQAIDSGIELLKRASFEKISFLREVPVGLANWVRIRIADETLVAADSIELSKLDFLVSRLPAELGVQRIFNRNKFLRLVLYKSYKWPLDLVVKTIKIISAQAGAPISEESGVRREAVKLLTFQIFFSVLAISIFGFFITSSVWIKCLSGFVSLATLTIACQLGWRDCPNSVTPFFVISAAWRSGAKLLKELLTTKSGWILMVAVLLISVGILLVTYYAKQLVPILFALMLLIVLVASVKKLIETKRSKRFLKELSNSQVNNKVLHARTANELYVWLASDVAAIVPTTNEARSLLILLDRLPIQLPNGSIRSPLFSIRKKGKHLPHKNLLMEYLMRSP